MKKKKLFRERNGKKNYQTEFSQEFSRENNDTKFPVKEAIRQKDNEDPRFYGDLDY